MDMIEILMTLEKIESAVSNLRYHLENVADEDDLHTKMVKKYAKELHGLGASIAQKAV